MQALFKRLPIVLVVFIVLMMAMTDQVVGTGSRVYVTLLAPILWVGLDLLFGSDRTASQE